MIKQLFMETFMKYAIFICLLLASAANVVSMEPWLPQIAPLNDQDDETEYGNATLDLAPREIFQVQDNLINDIGTPYFDFEGNEHYSLPLEELGFENVKPVSANPSPVKPAPEMTSKNNSTHTKRKLSFKSEAPAEIPEPQDSPEKKQQRKQFLKEMKERREQKRLRLLANFYKSDSQQSPEAKAKAQQLEKQLAQRKEQHRLNNVIYDLNRNMIPHASAPAVIAPKELPRKKNLVFVHCVVVESSQLQAAQSEPDESSNSDEASRTWPEHILAMIEAKNKERLEQEKQTQN